MAFLAAMPIWALAQEPFSVSMNIEEDGSVALEWSSAGDGLVYTVESRDSLRGGAWQAAPTDGAWPIGELTFTDRRERGAGTRFYRVVAGAENAVERGRLISAESLRRFNVFELTVIVTLAGAAGVDIQNGVEVFKVVYETVDVRGHSTIASGAVALPQGLSVAAPVMSYQHGTVLQRDEVPSRFDTSNLESMAPVILSGLGSVAVASDYLGLGDSPGRHPYILANPSATAVVDMLRAGRALALERSITMNEQLFLIGYSEGGYVTMAAHREIQERHADEFQVTASAPMAGPHDLSGTMAEIMTSDQPFTTPYYLPYVLLAYDDAYDLFDSPAEVFAEPYASTAIPLMDGTHSGSEVDALLPSVPSQMLTPEFLAAFTNDEEHPLRVALRENDLYRWIPRAPLRMYHCAGDRTVPKANSEIALASFLALEATDVSLEDPLPAADHGGCILPSLVAAQAWLNSFR